MKPIRRKEFERLMRLNERLCAEFTDPARQSTDVWRGDVRAIQWAARWIRESVKSGPGEGPVNQP